MLVLLTSVTCGRSSARNEGERAGEVVEGGAVSEDEGILQQLGELHPIPRGLQQTGESGGMTTDDWVGEYMRLQPTDLGLHIVPFRRPSKRSLQRKVCCEDSKQWVCASALKGIEFTAVHNVSGPAIMPYATLFVSIIAKLK